MRRPVEVLAVGDTATIVAEVRAAAEPLGARVRAVPAGEEALRSLLHEPDIAAIVIDRHVAGMDALEAIGAIRRRRKTRHVPLLVVADSGAPDCSAAAYAAGAADYLTRPVDADVLRAKLSVFVDLHVLGRRPDARAPSRLHDRLTGLPNRDLFADRLEQALVRAHRRPVPLAVLFVDLKGVQRVGREHGAGTGDAVLVEAGRRLRSLLRTADTVARHGGGEFMVLAEDVADPRAARDLGERVAEELARPYAGGLELTAAVGVAFTANPSATNADALIRRADHAMCRSRRPGAPRAEVSRVRPGLLAPSAP